VVLLVFADAEDHCNAEKYNRHTSNNGPEHPYKRAKTSLLELSLNDRKPLTLIRDVGIESEGEEAEEKIRLKERRRGKKGLRKGRKYTSRIRCLRWCRIQLRLAN